MSIVVGVLSTLLALLLIWAFWKLGRWVWRRWRKRQPGWWRIDGKKWAKRIMICRPWGENTEQINTTQVARDEERVPLLA